MTDPLTLACRKVGRLRADGRACEKEQSSTQKRTTLEPLPRAVADEQTLSRSLVHVVFEGAGIIHAAQPAHMRCGKEKLESTSSRSF